MQLRSQTITVSILILILVLILAACEKIIPLSEFDFDYTRQVKIEGDFFPKNLGKSILRVDHTFTIADTMDLSRVHIRNANAVLLHGADTLSTFTWRDSATSYLYYDIQEYSPEIMNNPDSLAQYLDSLSYGAYTLDRLDFELLDDEIYTLVVSVDGVDYTTTFTPFPAIELQNLTVDSIQTRANSWGMAGTYDMLHTTIAMIPDSAKLIWPEDPTAWFYTIWSDQIDDSLKLVPGNFSFPGPVLSLLGVAPGVYELVIGAMNDTFYKHYFLGEFPPNHPVRNFFDNDALGYAGTLNEVYLTVNLIPAPSDSTR